MPSYDVQEGHYDASMYLRVQISSRYVKWGILAVKPQTAFHPVTLYGVLIA